MHFVLKSRKVKLWRTVCPKWKISVVGWAVTWALLEVCQVLEIIGDASFINAPVYDDDDEVLVEDADPVACEVEIADTTTSQVHVAPAIAASSPSPVHEKKVCIIHLNLCQFKHTMHWLFTWNWHEHLTSFHAAATITLPWQEIGGGLPGLWCR